MFCTFAELIDGKQVHDPFSLILIGSMDRLIESLLARLEDEPRLHFSMLESASHLLCIAATLIPVSFIHTIYLFIVSFLSLIDYTQDRHGQAHIWDSLPQHIAKHMDQLTIEEFKCVDLVAVKHMTSYLCLGCRERMKSTYSLITMAFVSRCLVSSILEKRLQALGEIKVSIIRPEYCDVSYFHFIRIWSRV